MPKHGKKNRGFQETNGARQRSAVSRIEIKKKNRSSTSAPMARRSSGGGQLDTTDYRHANEKRVNNPPAAMAHEGQAPRVSVARYEYNPHLPPVLRFDSTGKSDQYPELIEEAGKRALTPAEQKVLFDAVAAHEPWLEWSGKSEQHKKGGFSVDPVVLHIHERVSAQAIVRAALREDVQRDMFADPQQSYQQAIQFYKHPMDWANRLILGDSLQVMSSLARRENLAGKVQMIYIDPPYGIRFASNFQPRSDEREVKDKEADLTREPEMVKAYRDTWQLGVHSYLAYLRDRLKVALDLLSDSGSLFVQISDEHLHRIMALLDDVVGSANRISLIPFVKTAGQADARLPSICDYLAWYGKDARITKVHPLYVEKEVGGEYASEYNVLQFPSGFFRPMTSAEKLDLTLIPAEARVLRLQSSVSQGRSETGSRPFNWRGNTFVPGANSHWKTTEDGLRRLIAADRIVPSGTFLKYKRYLTDFAVVPRTNIWRDTATGGSSSDPKVYVVQTVSRVIGRCILMTTDPGDLVLDPTCGSGTTANAAEQWGRRWITIDTSRVAVSIARQRVVTARFDHYKTKVQDAGLSSNPGSGFEFRTVPHITLKSIAQSTRLDSIFEKYEAALDRTLAACNKALNGVSRDIRQRLATKLVEKQRTDGKRAVTDADRRRWELPESFDHWTVPFDADPVWPRPLQDAVIEYRKSWRAKMDEVNACIEANAEQEALVDDPVKVPGVVRVSGPFTVEGVRPEELSMVDGRAIDLTPNEFEPDDAAAGGVPEVQNLHAYLHEMARLIRTDGLTFIGNKYRKFARLDPLFQSGTGSVLHAHGLWEGSDLAEKNNVAVAFGPQYGPVTAEQVSRFIRASRRYDELVIAGFSFDAEASAAIQETVEQHTDLKVHQAYISPTINPGMNGLLKETPKSQLFTVFGQPDVKVKKTRDGFVVELQGVDVYDPVANVIRSTGAEKVAAWFLDGDYDGRCFCITQAFFPDQNAWEKIAKALKSSADEAAFAAFNGTKSLPFDAGKHKRVAVKVIDPRGNEVMTIKPLEE